MFVVNEDLSVSLNRGDAGIIKIPRKVDGKYEVNTGDVLRLRVFPKKNCEKVELIKDYSVSSTSEYIELALSGSDTRLGDVINKPTTYWYEIEQNPEWSLSDGAVGVYPKTIVGYDEDGPKVFLLYPEGDDSGDLPVDNIGRKVNVSDEAVESIIENELFQEYVDDKTRDITEKANTSLNTAKQIADTLQSKLNNGEFKGETGEQGEKGEAFTYEDFTAEQLASLKGEQGEKGEPFTYEDFTPEQLEALKGEKGAQGEKGEAFTYEDFTPEQLEKLKCAVVDDEMSDDSENPVQNKVAKNYVDGEVGEISEIFDKSVNLYNEKTNLNYKEVSNSTGIIHDNTVWAVTQPILLKKGQYTITHDRDNNRHFGYVSFYDMNMVFDKKVSLFTGVPVDTEKKVASLVIEQNCYARFSGIIDRITGTELMIVRGTELPTEYVPYKNEIKPDYLPENINKVVTTEHYSLDIQTLKSNGYMTWISEDSGSKLIVSLIFVPAIMDNGVQHKIIDVPFEFINVNNVLTWSNQNKFKNVGISSPVLAQALGLNGTLWFDTIINIMNEMGFPRKDTIFEFYDANTGDNYGTLVIELTGTAQTHSSMTELKSLWETILEHPETKLIFEYQKQENITTYEAAYLYDASSTVEIGEV